MAYNHASEWQNRTNTQLNIQAKRLFESFLDQYASQVHLHDMKSIESAYVAAQEQGIFAKAQELRQYYFGNNIHTYGVVYVSDACVEGCTFCPAGKWNREYKPKTMNVNEVVADVLCTLLQGHSNICILQANWRENAFMRQITRWLPQVIQICEPCGLKEIILNVQTLSQDNYKKIIALRDALGSQVVIQIRVFQESYISQYYEQVIPQTRLGNKHDFKYRLNTQMSAWNAGADAVGCGVLFGLSPHPLQELEALVAHAQHLLNDHVNLVRICLPSAHEVVGLPTRIVFDLAVTNQLYKKYSELIYALARLALPQMNWVMSERDPVDVRDMLVQYATETTVGVRPGVGDNLYAYLKAKKGSLFVQATVYREDPTAYVMRMGERGYNVLLDLSTKRQEQIKVVLKNLGF